jgi:sulfite reductase (NADPH) flavoprotein alpha-component
MNIILEGAHSWGLDAAYIARLENQELFVPPVYPPFVPPEALDRVFKSSELCDLPDHTALFGHVFDMTGAPAQLQHLRGLFGGRDLTLFTMKRHDTSSGQETWEDVHLGNITAPVRAYLNAYLHNFAQLFRYAGRL